MKQNLSKVPPHPGKPAKVHSGPPPRPQATRMMDGTGIEVPVELAGIWSESHKLKDLIRLADSIWFTVKYENAREDKLFAPVDIKAVSSLINQLKAELQLAVPYAVCPECNGIASADSCFCKGRGYLSKFHWDTCVTPETKKITGRK